MKTNATELNLKELENVNAGGQITGFVNPFRMPGAKPRKDKTESNQDND